MFIDWFTVLAQALNFLVLVALLKRFLYKPILDAIDARERRLAQQIRDAQAAHDQALAEKAEYGRRTTQFEAQRDALLAGAKEEARKERAALLDAARRESDELRARLAAALQEEQAAIARDVVRRAQEAAASTARRALADLAGQSVEERIVARFLGRLSELSEGDRAAFAPGAGEPLVVRTAFEISPESRRAVEQALRALAGAGALVRFETAPELIGGIETAANGRKIAWNFGEYVDDLEAQVRRSLAVAGSGDGRDR